ncbi:MAG TPA: hypothetical protein LFV91_00170 [Rickettsia endosymbiont of Bembidion nr. Transversale]|nr:hypothetical protein [Rickettsia endosymbiont of Bembidion nr. Transversale]
MLFYNVKKITPTGKNIFNRKSRKEIAAEDLMTSYNLNKIMPKCKLYRYLYPKIKFFDTKDNIFLKYY